MFEGLWNAYTESTENVDLHETKDNLTALQWTVRENINDPDPIATFQKIAEKLQQTIKDNFSQNKVANRGNFKVERDWTSWYNYKFISYGRETTFCCEKQWKKTFLYLTVNGKKYFKTDTDSFIRSYDRKVSTFLWYANSANKTFSKVEQVKRLEKLDWLWNNSHNTKNRPWYKKKYEEIMKIEEFSDLELDNTSDNSMSWPLLWSEKEAYLNERRSAFKEKMRKKHNAKMNTKDKEIIK